jgi:hypothetical protein
LATILVEATIASTLPRPSSVSSSAKRGVALHGGLGALVDVAESGLDALGDLVGFVLHDLGPFIHGLGVGANGRLGGLLVFAAVAEAALALVFMALRSRPWQRPWRHAARWSLVRRAGFAAAFFAGAEAVGSGRRRRPRRPWARPKPFGSLGGGRSGVRGSGGRRVALGASCALAGAAALCGLGVVVLIGHVLASLSSAALQHNAGA